MVQIITAAREDLCNPAWDAGIPPRTVTLHYIINYL